LASLEWSRPYCPAARSRNTNLLQDEIGEIAANCFFLDTLRRILPWLLYRNFMTAFEHTLGHEDAPKRPPAKQEHRPKKLALLKDTISS
jgi:hypothetical protein